MRPLPRVAAREGEETRTNRENIREGGRLRTGQKKKLEGGPKMDGTLPRDAGWLLAARGEENIERYRNGEGDTREHEDTDHEKGRETGPP